MNETTFARWILREVKETPKIANWYAKHLEGKELANTIETMERAYFDDNGLSLREITILGIFIGLTTEVKKEKSE